MAAIWVTRSRLARGKRFSLGRNRISESRGIASCRPIIAGQRAVHGGAANDKSPSDLGRAELLLGAQPLNLGGVNGRFAPMVSTRAGNPGDTGVNSDCDNLV